MRLVLELEPVACQDRGPRPGCGAPMVWAVTVKGRRIPIDPEPSPDGNLYLIPGRDGQAVACFTKEGGEHQRKLQGLGVPLYTTHFATCPHADAHRSPPRRLRELSEREKDENTITGQMGDRGFED